jgi:hypothetical protein
MILQHVFRKWNHSTNNNVSASHSSGYKGGFCIVASYNTVGICRSFGTNVARFHLHRAITPLFWSWKKQGSSKQWQISVRCMSSYPSRQTSDMPVTKTRIQLLKQTCLQRTLIELNVISQDEDRTQKRPQVASSAVSQRLIKFPNPSVR